MAEGRPKGHELVQRQVEVSAQIPASPQAIWQVLAGFDVGWHPAVEQCETSVNAAHEVIRRFRTNDGAHMVERLTYQSHSDHQLAYEMISGIEGAEQYQARLGLTRLPEGSTQINWQADIVADAARIDAIAAGTKQIFEAGIAALAAPAALPVATATEEPVVLRHSRIGRRMLEGVPRIALNVAPDECQSAETICLLLHGIGGRARNWDHEVSALGSLMPSVAMDLRGYGDSQLGFAQSDVEDYFQDILATMAHFKAQKLVLGGLSYGAWLAASFALRHPDKIAGLILCGGCTGMSEAALAEREAFRLAREVPLDAGQSPADFAPSVVDVIAGPEVNAKVRDELLRSMQAIPSATYRDALNCFCNPPGKLDFSKASFPVLLMTGEHDRLAPVAEIRQVSRAFAEAGAPFVGFEAINGAGHVCNLEAPEAVSRHMLRFVKNLVAKSRPSAKASRKSQKRAQILAAALREFSANGYSGASMRAIAEGAGVSKPTLYQYIGQKEDLFRAVLEQGRALILAPIDMADGQDMIEVLWEFSWAYADYVLSPENLSIARLVLGEAERVPDVARQFHETGPRRVLEGISRYLLDARDTGRLTFEDAELAAGDLWSLILSEPRSRALHFPLSPPREPELFRAIQNGLRVFLMAYSTDPGADLQRLALVGQDRPLKRRQR